MQMVHMKNSIQEAMKVIEETTTLFYQQKNKEGFLRLDSTLNSLMQAVNEIVNYQVDKKVQIIDEQILNVVLTEAMKAIEQKDTILLSDLLIFEVKDMFEECLSKI